MDAGLLIRWGQILPGREDAALALFDETVTYFLSLMESGKVTGFEPFLFTMSDFEEEQGFFIVKGPVAEMFSIMDTDEYATIVTKANMLLRHVRINMMTVGDGVTEQLARYRKAREVLHF